MRKILTLGLFVSIFLLFFFAPHAYASLDLEDKTSNNNDFTTNNGGVASSSVPHLLTGSEKSVSLDPGDSLVAPDSSSLDITGSLTIEAWVYITGNSGDQMIASKYADQNLSYQAYIQSDESILLNLSSTGAHSPGHGYGYSGPSKVPLNTWTHLAFVYTPSSVTLYINGSAVSDIESSVPSSIFSGDTELKMINNSNGILIVDDLRIWSTARTSTEIANNKNHELDGDESGLVAYYPFEDDVAALPINLEDKTSNNNDLVTNNGVVASSDTPSLLVDSLESAELDPSDSLVALDSSSLDITGSLTIEAWVYITGNSGDQMIASKYADQNLSYQAYIQSDESILLNLSSTGTHNPGNGYGHSGPSKVPLNTWTHLAFVYTPSSVTLYINGSAVSDTEVSVPSSIFSGGTDLTIRNGSNGTFRIDDLRIWNTARTSTEITNNKNSELDGDESGLVAYYTFDKYNNVAPVVDEVTASNNLIAVNQTATISASFSDINTSDTHTAVIDWGDSTTSNGSISESNGSGAVTGQHVYTSVGIYTVTVTVTDNNGLSGDNVSTQDIVVYDPTSNHVAGLGLMISPEGAYEDDPDFVGLALFAFQFKYAGNPPAPTGNTAFVLIAANMNFVSTSYNSLSVNGSIAQYTGAGSVNGQSGYSFMVKMDDANPDKFRMKIWNTSTGAVKYDNQWGDLDNANLTQNILLGDIIVN